MKDERDTGDRRFVAAARAQACSARQVGVRQRPNDLESTQIGALNYCGNLTPDFRVKQQYPPWQVFVIYNVYLSVLVQIYHNFWNRMPRIFPWNANKETTKLSRFLSHEHEGGTYLLEIKRENER